MNTNTHESIKIFALSIVLCLLISGMSYGDGKFYLERVPVGVPYQRAVLMYEDGKETLLLQSQYKTTEPEDANSIAWVIPVPSVPELASIDANEANHIFFMLGFWSRPNVVPITRIGLFVGIALLMFFCIWKPLDCYFRKQIKAGANDWVICILRIGVMLILLFILSLSTATTLGVKGVDVIKSEIVGIYDVTVIRADDALSITGWLNDNGFGYDQEDAGVFEQYVKKDWCFVTAKIHKDASIDSAAAVSEGLAAPLILRFDSSEAVYPMALTGTADSDTEVLLYVFSDHKMECGDRLKLTYFDELGNPFEQESFSATVKPEGFFDQTEAKSRKMCKFKGTLAPDQMAEDIIFKQAKDDKPYRETKWR